ncbi:7978_t:CDS:2 [Entrophospora sp. SA101]|nr:7859_t:CDS:2 [Entrophospora sp. SA101]CAJ0754634.1 7978_t:CDS:2 [Entrophospora sp. SA101]CAJ0845197.1 8798_t:CDS:2 [Entrophospora sp. SA101]
MSRSDLDDLDDQLYNNQFDFDQFDQVDLMSLASSTYPTQTTTNTKANNKQQQDEDTATESENDNKKSSSQKITKKPKSWSKEEDKVIYELLFENIQRPSPNDLVEQLPERSKSAIRHRIDNLYTKLRKFPDLEEEVD